MAPALCLLAAALGASSVAAQSPPVSDPTASPWTARIRECVDAVDWGDGALSILVHDPERGSTVFERQADLPALPGALTQIVTASAAFERLGLQFRFSTEFNFVASPDDEHVAQTVIVRGTGDPSLSTAALGSREVLWQPFDRWARILRERGIRRISGSVLAIDDAFDENRTAPGWPTGRAGDPRYPGVGALNFNGNCVEIDWRAGGRVGSKADFAIFPPLPRDYLRLSSNVRIVEGIPRPRLYERLDSGSMIVATGEIARDSQATDRAAIEDPGRFFARVLRARLIDAGIKVDGEARTLRDLDALPPEELPQTGRFVPLDVHFSPPLPEILARMMQDDSALEAESVFKALGHDFLDRSGNTDAHVPVARLPGSFDSGAATVKDYLESIHLPGPFFSIADGSGRSAANRLSARQLLFLLKRGRGDLAYGPMFESCFPRVGDPAFPTGRFPSSDWADPAASGGIPAPPPIWVKLAPEETADAAAGWLRAGNGHTLYFVIMVNGSRLSPLTRQREIDRLLIDLTR
jgi:D-alanyl-D-alanine carboxypeptidase/D-alanyl-D-alanine-endopeptidase (penicillin-binding protein 4)